MKIKNRRRKQRPEKTTMRAGLSGLESEALKDYLRSRCGGLTIGDCLKQALDMWLLRGGNTSLSEIAEKFKNRRATEDGLVQEELF